MIKESFEIKFKIRTKFNFKPLVQLLNIQLLSKLFFSITLYNKIYHKSGKLLFHYLLVYSLKKKHKYKVTIEK